MLSSKSWCFICSHRRWSDLLCSRRCLDDHSDQTLKKETSQSTPQLVKTVAKEIMKVESSQQIRLQTCCSVTIGSKSHLVAPAVSTDDHPVIKKMLIVDSVKKNSKPWTWPLRKNEKQPEPRCLDCTSSSCGRRQGNVLCPPPTEELAPWPKTPSQVMSPTILDDFHYSETTAAIFHDESVDIHTEPSYY